MPNGIPAEGACESSVLDVENIVSLEIKELPLTGPYSIDTKIPGWKWDRRILENHSVNSQKTWTPLVRSGIYAIHHQPKRLYSDTSFCGKLAVGQIIPLGYIILRPDAMLDSISVTLFKRDKGFINWSYVIQRNLLVS